MTDLIGIGFAGAGTVTQSVHLPVVADLQEYFTVRRVVDTDANLAQAVADRCGAIGSMKFEDILGDERIDVVAICSPDRFHAEQVVAACEAGKRVVLCEKPLAVSILEAEAIRTAAEASGTAVFVGTMHAYDPAYREALRAWRKTGDEACLVRSAIFLPRNEEFIEQATQLIKGQPPTERGRADGDLARLMVRRAMLGLAIHDLPLVRDFQPRAGRLMHVEFVPPFGYCLIAEHGGCVTELTAVMPGEWPHKWTFEVIGRTHYMRVAMPPSFVMAGSARIEIESRGSTEVFHFDRNGYQSLWETIGKTVSQGVYPPFALETVIEDLRFALDLADKADALLEVVA